MKSIFLTVITLLIMTLTTVLQAKNSQTSEIREIYLVRHAEKQVDGTKDPSLTKKGRQRAENLAKQLKSKNITVIYSTDYKRTIETASPLAKMLAIDITKYNPRDLAAFAKQLKSEKGNALDVGHSNTTPELTSLVSGEQQQSMDESVYDRLYLLQFSDGKVMTHILNTDASPEE